VFGIFFVTIGDRLKEERVRLGYSQPGFYALGGGKGKQTMIQWEKGETYPNAEFLEAIARVGADVLYIVTGVRVAPGSSALIAAEPCQPYGLPPDEAALLDNYRHSSPEAQAALRATGAALAQHDQLKNCKGGK
jgi:transcriptional regulator with XRE-family HTH domain